MRSLGYLAIGNRLTLGFALALGLSGAPGFSGIAQAKPKDSPTEIAVADGFRVGARTTRAALDIGDVNAANAAIAGLTATNPTEKYIAGGLRLELASRRSDPQAQRRALTDILESGGAPSSQLPYLRYLAGYYSYYLGEFDDAIAQVNYARQLGYAPTETTVLLADATLKKKKKTREGMALVEQAMTQQRASGQPVPEAWYDRAIALSYNLGNWSDVARYNQQKLAQYPTTGNWRSGLTNSLAAPNIPAQVQLDFYRLQAANGALASERDYQAYATLAARNGYEAEAKAIIEAGRSNGDLTATEPVTSALLKSILAKANKDVATLNAQKAKAATASSGDAALKTGDLYFSLSQYAQAVPYYQLALSKGGVDAARVNSRLGVALARSGDLPGGKAALAQASGDWSAVSGFWSVWVDQQAKKSASMIPPKTVPTIGVS